MKAKIAILFLITALQSFAQAPASDRETIIADQSDSNSTLGHFTWGADLGTSIDMTANDMSSIDLTGYFGYKGAWIRFAGIGAGINSMISNSSRNYPIYAMLRTSFSPTPQLCFLDLRAGISVNNISTLPSQTGFYGSIGIGFTLAKGKKFSSHVILSYNYLPLRPVTVTYTKEMEVIGAEHSDETTPKFETVSVTDRISLPDIHYAALRIGCSF